MTGLLVPAVRTPAAASPARATPPRPDRATMRRLLGWYALSRLVV